MHAPSRRASASLAVAAAVLVAGTALLACPVAQRPAPRAVAPSCRAAQVDPARLRGHVEALAVDLSPRDLAHPENLDRAADYVAGALAAAGARVREQVFELSGRRFRNVIGEVGPATAERIVVGAHYDAAEGTPGADDNASGVAGLIELARVLDASPPPLRVELVGYTLEEPPAFATDAMGSVAHARRLADDGVPVRLMIAIEMIGAFSDERGSQRYPTPVKKVAYPSRGNFIAVVGRIGSPGPISDVAGAIAEGRDLPVETLAAPAALPGVDFSDHRSFWAEGYQAVMVTDTAFLRNARYHTADDTPETLDYARMAEVVEGISCAVRAVASR
jgi:Zn-dependent M28 family amino/carboxypeptidase